MSGKEHAGHRQRLKQRFLKEGSFEGFADHEILEMLLFYSIPQKDTNLLAHTLINKFGSLHEVLDASFEELLEVKGVSSNVATFIKAFVPFWRAYESDKYKKQNIFLDTTPKILEFFKDKYSGFSKETFSVVCLDGKNMVRSFDIVAIGSINKVVTDNRVTLKKLIENKSVCAIVCHNHPGGVAIPSESDVDVTRILVALLKSLGVKLLDHIIIGNDGDATSMKDSAFYYNIFS